jgi:collagenase-like PrtC family protease
MTAKIKYSIPFNGDLSLMKDFLRTGMIYEVYCMGPEGKDLSYKCYQPICSKKSVEGLFELAEKYRTRINLLINSPLLSVLNVEKAVDYTVSLRKKFRLSAVTLSDPFQISRFKRALPDLEIDASVIMDLDSFDKVERILKSGVTTVNLALNLNREFDKLKSIASLKKYYPGFKIKLIVNHLCYLGCPFSAQHYFLTEMERVMRVDMPRGMDIDKCASFSLDKKELIRRPFIRPEDVPYYGRQGIGDVFKILWRHSRSEVLRRTVSAYLDNSYKGNLFDIVETHEERPSYYCDNQAFPRDFVNRVTACDKATCRSCRYCGRVADTAIRKL